MGQEYSLKGLTLVKIEKKLTNSFNNVKQDLKELKKQASSLNSKSETSNLDLQSIRKSYTRADKFLILEKKVDLLAKLLQSIRTLEKDVKKIDKNKTEISLFEREAKTLTSNISKLKDDFKKILQNFNYTEKIPEIQTKIEKKIKEVSKSKDKSLKEARKLIDQKLEALNQAISRLTKTDVKTEKSLNKLTKDINAEFKEVDYLIEKVNVKLEERITKKEFNSLKQAIEKETKTLEEAITRTNKELSTKIKESKALKLFEEVNKKIEHTRKEAGELGFELDKELTKRIDSTHNTLLKDIRDTNKTTFNLKKQISELEKKHKEDMKLFKQYVEEEEIEKIIADVNKEFEKTDKTINSLNRSLKQYATKDDLFNQKTKLLRELERANKRIEKVNVELDKKATVKQVETLVNDINKEFSEVHGLIKEQSKEIKELKSNITSIEKNKVDKKTYKKDIERLNDKTGFLKRSIIDIKSNFVRDREFQSFVKEFNKTKSETVTKKEFNTKVKTLNHKARKTRKKQPKAITYTANTLIVLAFISIILAIILFFFSNTSFISYFAFGAVVLFVVGIILRISHTLKE